MKKTLAILALVAAAGIAYAALDAYTQITVKTLQRPVATSGTTTNTAVDVYDCKGIANWLVTIGPRTAGASLFTSTVYLTTSATSGGTYTAVTNVATIVTATGTVSSVKVDAASLKRYVKLVRAATTNSVVIGSQLLYPK